MGRDLTLETAGAGVELAGIGGAGAQRLRSLDASAVRGTAQLNGDIYTTRGLSFGGAVELAGNTRLDSAATTGTGITLAGAVTGAGKDLTLRTAGAGVELAGIGGAGAQRLNELDVSGVGGTAQLNGDIYTTQALNFGGAVELAGNTKLDSAATTGTGITLAGAVTGARRDLTLQTGGAGVELADIGTAARRLNKLDVSGVGGTVQLSGDIYTRQALNFGGAVELTGNTRLDSATRAGTGITLAGAVTGAGQDLTLETAGAGVELAGIGGAGAQRLRSLDASAVRGTAQLNGDIYTTRGLSFGGAVELAGNTRLDSAATTGTGIALAGAITGANKDLTLRAGGGSIDLSGGGRGINRLDAQGQGIDITGVYQADRVRLDSSAGIDFRGPGKVTASNATQVDAIDLSAGGAITQNSGNPVLVLSGGASAGIKMTADDGLGNATQSLQIDAGTVPGQVDAENTNSGDIHLSLSQGANVTRVNNQVNNAMTRLAFRGTTQLGGALSRNISLAGSDATLALSTTAGNLEINTDLAGAYKFVLDAKDDLLFLPGKSVTTTSTANEAIVLRAGGAVVQRVDATHAAANHTTLAPYAAVAQSGGVKIRSAQGIYGVAQGGSGPQPTVSTTVGTVTTERTAGAISNDDATYRTTVRITDSRLPGSGVNRVETTPVYFRTDARRWNIANRATGVTTGVVHVRDRDGVVVDELVQAATGQELQFANGGGSGLELDGNLITQGGNIVSGANKLVLGQDSVISTGAGLGGDIIIRSLVDGNNRALTLIAGTGDIALERSGDILRNVKDFQASGENIHLRANVTASREIDLHATNQLSLEKDVTSPGNISLYANDLAINAKINGDKVGLGLANAGNVFKIGAMVNPHVSNAELANITSNHLVLGRYQEFLRQGNRIERGGRSVAIEGVQLENTLGRLIFMVARLRE